MMADGCKSINDLPNSLRVFSISISVLTIEVVGPTEGVKF